MATFSLTNSVFQVYIIAAALMVLKVMGQGWMTVYRMMRVNTGFASPEDTGAGILNKTPNKTS